MQWETFRRSASGRAELPPSVTITTRGVASLSRSAKDALGDPDEVELLWDANTRTMGIRPAKGERRYAYKVRRPSTGGTAIVTIKAFAEYYGIDTTWARRRPAVIRDGVLCINTAEPGELVTSNRARTPRSA